MIIAGCVLLTVGGWFAYQKYQQARPVYALLQIKEAYENHDLETFKKHVAVGPIVNSAIDQVMEQNIGKTASNPLIEEGMKIADDLLALVKPRVSETIEDQVYQAVKTGKLELDNSGDLAVTSLKEASEPFLEGDYQFEDISSVERSGTNAVVTLKFSSRESIKPFLLKCKMTENNNDWQLTEILNAAELMKLHEETTR